MKPSILITGATGFFGQGFVRRLLQAPHYNRICIFSRGEYAQALMRERFNNDPRLRWFIGDVRDRSRLRRAMEGVQDVVHAAALKRIEVGHNNPIEMVQTNVMGTVNVLEAAHDAGVQRIVALSSDKAFQPVSAYGASKQLMESLCLAFNNTRGAHGPKVSLTRYGNVSGSTGSVIPRWRSMLANGAKEVPVTDPDCTRFWMSLDEAVSLVETTLDTMVGGELNIPDLPAYRLLDLATAMGATVRVTGLPEWEKMHESMCDGNSSDRARRMSVAEIRERLKEV